MLLFILFITKTRLLSGHKANLSPVRNMQLMFVVTTLRLAVSSKLNTVVEMHN